MDENQDLTTGAGPEPTPASDAPAAQEPTVTPAQPAWEPSAAPAPPLYEEPLAWAPPPAAIPDEPVRHPSYVRPVAIAVTLSLLAGAAAGVGGSYLVNRGRSTSTGANKIELVSGTTEEVVSAVAAVALPSVVSIKVSGGQTSSSGGGLPDTHPDVEMQSEGSGVAYKATADGGTYIITNNHVVEGATSITVTDANGDSFEGTLVGGDVESDIAVVRVDAEIPLVELGDSDELVVGQTVVAIGSPFGLKLSVSSGIISALHRALSDFGDTSGTYPYMDAIQTDAAINPGNSGGALLDRNGKLIGVPSAIYSDTGVSDGVGLAIPVNKAVSAADELIDKGSVDTPFLGVLGQTVSEDLVASENLPVDEGAYVVEITAGTEAEKAGLIPGDVIVRVDDSKIRSMDDLVLAVRQHAVGDTVTLTLWRDGKETTIEMKIGVKPATTQ